MNAYPRESNFPLCISSPINRGIGPVLWQKRHNLIWRKITKKIPVFINVIHFQICTYWLFPNYIYTSYFCNSHVFLHTNALWFGYSNIAHMMPNNIERFEKEKKTSFSMGEHKTT